MCPAPQPSPPWADHALDALVSAGLRRGGARTTVVRYLGRQRCCRSAAEIHADVAREGRRIGIASVYRVLDQLQELRLVHRVDIGDGVTRYEAAQPDGGHHHHLVCDDCGKVEAFSDDTLETALERVAGRRGYEMETHEVVLHGACGDCRD
jgi:Fur family transcriptional regulator, ferric uptake regulator